MRKVVLFLGADLFPIYQEFVRGLKEAGAFVVGVCIKDKIPWRLKYYLDFKISLKNITDHLEVVRNLPSRLLERIDSVETTDENLVVPAARIREKLSLPGVSVEQAVLCRDKAKMKQFLASKGIPCAVSKVAKSKEQVMEIIEKIGLPVVIKPRDAMGSLGTFRIHSSKDIDSAIKKLLAVIPKGVVVEEFVEGHEGFYDTLTVNNKVVFTFIGHYYPNVLTALSDRNVSPKMVITNRINANGYRELHHLGKRVIELLGLDTTATHMEWFFGPRGLKFSEIGARPAGERMWDMYKVVGNFDIYREWANAVVWRKVVTFPSYRLACGHVQIRPPKDGYIKLYKGVDSVLSKYRNLITESYFQPPGSRTTPLYKGYMGNCWLLSLIHI